MERMGTFMEEITTAGVLLATDGLQPSSKGGASGSQEGR